MNKETMSQLVQDVHDGIENPLKAFAILKDIETHLKMCIEAVKEPALDEASKHDKTFTDSGFIFERRNGRAIYSFKKIAEWSEADKAKKDIEKKYKAFYQAYQQGSLNVSQDGEEIELPEVTYTADVLTVKGGAK